MGMRRISGGRGGLGAASRLTTRCSGLASLAAELGIVRPHFEGDALTHMNTDALISVALGTLGICLALRVFPPLFERLAGWPHLLSHFGLPPPHGPLIPLGFASLGRLMTIPVRWSASAEGLHIVGSFFPPWRPKRSVLVPWASVAPKGFRNTLFGTIFVISADTDIPFIAKPSVTNRVLPYLVHAGAPR